MSYKKGQSESLVSQSKGKIWNPLNIAAKAIGIPLGALATSIRRPVGYELEGENARASQEGNWTDTARNPLYRGMFNLPANMGEDLYIKNEDGTMSFNPDSTGSKEMQAVLNESFEKARQGELVNHPNLPDAGKSFYRASDDAIMGDAYFDKQGNIVDYWDIGLDKGEKIWGGLGSFFDKDRQFINKSNLLRAAVDPFTSPKVFTGKATTTANTIGQYSPGKSEKSSDKWYPGKHLKGLLGKTKELFGGKQSEIEQEYLVNPEIHKKHYQTLPQHIRDQFASMEEYKGTADQNLQLLQHLGGSGVSIVDYLSGQGQGSSFADRKKLWESMGK